MLPVIRQTSLRHGRLSAASLTGHRLGHRYASGRGGTFPPRRRSSLPSGGLISLLGVGLGTLGTGAMVMSLTSEPIQADSGNLQAKQLAPAESESFGSLFRAYIVYTMCAFPSLIDVAPKALDVLMGIPLVKNVTEAVVRVTFFDQFVGGDTAQGTLRLLHKLRAGNKGALFAYSIEVDEPEATGPGSDSKKKGPPVYKRCVDEMIRSIDVAADFEDGIVGNERLTGSGRRTWVAIKMTALLPSAQSLTALSSHIMATRPQHQPAIPFPGSPRPTDLDIILDERELKPPSKFLTNQDIIDLRELYSDLRRIGTRAQERGIKLIIDAEYSWYQPAVDAIQLALMREFNQLKNTSEGKSNAVAQPLIYGTFQAYLRRTPLHLAQSYRDAQANNYALGVKLVRGAYHTFETSAHEAAHSGSDEQHMRSLSISPDSQSPVWTTKKETDECYDECVKMLVGWVKDDVSSSSSSSWGVTRGWFGLGNGSVKKSPALHHQTIGLLFGTHNWSSVKLVLNELVGSGLATTTALEDGSEDAALRFDAEVIERVTFGQLFGMADELTDYIARRAISNTPMVVKYVPYGALSETMPYLSRRATENKSVLGDGHAVEERKRAGREIWKKVFG